MIELLLNLTLTFDQSVHLIVVHRLGKLSVDLFEFFQKIDRRLHGFFNDLLHRLSLVKLRLLLKIANGIAF